jgi:diguanylate cyclase (GGDEF)-like protein
MAITDDLTGLCNRRHIVHLLADELGRAQRYGRALSCVMFDVDHFKGVNDAHGHDAGDAVLAAVGAAAQEQCRQSDVVGRYGGEEFLVVLPETGPDGARAMGERIRGAIERVAVDHGGHALTVTASFGVATASPDAPGGGQDARAILKRADDALYRAKDRGRNRVESA